MRREPIRDRCEGRWKSILNGLGIDHRFLRDRHGPCPTCGGKDRFRFDDKGRGLSYCNHCGARDGFQLAQDFTGLPFKEVVKLIEAELGDATYDQPKPDQSAEEQREARLKIWKAGLPLERGDPAETYLSRRKLSGLGVNVLRYVPDCWHKESRQKLPAMVAAVQGVDGKVCALHRTYLTLDGEKANVEPVRKLTAGTLSAGACVRLGPQDVTLGVAEGIETAMAASRLGKVPVWAALNAGRLEAWEPPEGVKRVIVYMDRDASFTGQKAGYNLLYRLWRDKQLDLEDKAPRQLGQDYSDIWVGLQRANDIAEQRSATG